MTTALVDLFGKTKRKYGFLSGSVVPTVTDSEEDDENKIERSRSDVMLEEESVIPTVINMQFVMKDIGKFTQNIESIQVLVYH